MIIIRILGGYGNQLFGYALAKKLEYLGHKVRVDWSFFDNQPGDNDIRTPLKKYIDLDVQEVNSFEVLVCKVINKLKREQFKVWEDENVSLSPDVIFNSENKLLIGYWQNYKLFFDIKERIIEHVSNQCLINLNQYSQGMLNEINSTENTVAIHVRGGDYLTETNKKIFGNICTEEYYKNALGVICKKRGYTDIKETNCYVFTNDSDYAVKVLPEGVNYKYVSNNDDDGFMDMYLMSSCRDMIIANSTLSWWGAFLTTGQSKTIIVPQKWKNEHNRDNMILDEWIAI